MEHDKKIAFFLIQATMILLLGGCDTAHDLGTAILPAAPAKPDSSVADRFDVSGPQSASAVNSAIELSGKYARLSEEMVEQKTQNQHLLADNKRIKEQIDFLEPKLWQTQKELTEANDLLLEMRIELNNWKTNILGFREEIRSANTAQLEALFKILKVLGGEVAAEPYQQSNAVAAAVSANEPQATKRPGESNE